MEIHQNQANKKIILSEAHKFNDLMRIVYLEEQLANIKSGITKFSCGLTEENINTLIKNYEIKLKELYAD